MEDAQHRTSHRRAAVAAVGCLLVASVVVVWQAPEQIEEVELLSTGGKNEFEQAVRLKKLHAAYDRAKQNLQKLSLQYGKMGEQLQQAESHAAYLREDLEEKMAHIQTEFGLSVSAARKRFKTSALVTKPQAAAVLPRAGGSAPAETVTPQGDENSVQSVRTGGPEYVSKLSELVEVQKQLADENKKICELCDSSALLRINRHHTCSRCATAEVGGGDTDISDFLDSAAEARQAASAGSGGSEDATGSTDAARALPTLQLASLRSPREVQDSAAAIVDGLFGGAGAGAGAGAEAQAEESRGVPRVTEQEEEEEDGLGAQDRGEASKGRMGGGNLVAALGLAKAPQLMAADQGSQGDVRAATTPEDVGAGLRNAGRNSELMEVDRGDAGEKLGSRGAEGAVGAWFNAEGGQRLLLGVCWPTRREEASGTMCGACARSLGADVVSLGAAVSCSPYHPAEGRGR